MKVLMECGHTANATSLGDKPACVICGCYDMAIDDMPNLEGRKAKCTYCGKATDSSLDLAFFKYKPDGQFDEYYCGCRGWD